VTKRPDGVTTRAIHVTGGLVALTHSEVQRTTADMSRVRVWLIVFACWTMLALLFASQALLYKLHTGQTTHLLRDTMKHLEAGLAGARFARLHRSALVNVDRIRELRQDGDGNWEVVMLDGTRLSAGREADVRLREALGDSRKSEV
jgi:hypothetical protein